GVVRESTRSHHAVDGVVERGTGIVESARCFGDPDVVMVGVRGRGFRDEGTGRSGAAHAVQDVRRIDAVGEIERIRESKWWTAYSPGRRQPVLQVFEDGAPAEALPAVGFPAAAAVARPLPARFL